MQMWGSCTHAVYAGGDSLRKQSANIKRRARRRVSQGKYSTPPNRDRLQITMKTINSINQKMQQQGSRTIRNTPQPKWLNKRTIKSRANGNCRVRPSEPTCGRPAEASSRRRNSRPWSRASRKCRTWWTACGVAESSIRSWLSVIFLFVRTNISRLNWGCLLLRIMREEARMFQGSPGNDELLW